jgi:hypothetical protein
MKFEKKKSRSKMLSQSVTKQIDDVCIFSLTICGNHLCHARMHGHHVSYLLGLMYSCRVNERS